MAAGGVGRRAPIDRSEEVRDAVLDGLKDEDVLRVEARAAGDGGEVEGEGGNPVSGEALLEGQVADGAAENTDSVTAFVFCTVLLAVCVFRFVKDTKQPAVLHAECFSQLTSRFKKHRKLH